MKTARQVETMILELADAWKSYADDVTWLEGHPAACDLHSHTLGPHARCTCGLRRLESAIRALVMLDGITTKSTTGDSEGGADNIHPLELGA